jgi:hypothetical protein
MVMLPIMITHTARITGRYTVRTTGRYTGKNFAETY